MISLARALRYGFLGLKHSLTGLGPPAFVTLFVTSRCNARCDHCFYWRNIDDSAERDELTLDEFTRISASMGEIYNLLISGGEPFLRDDLADICIQFCRQNRVSHLVIPSNGFLPDKIVPQVEKILTRCPETRTVVQLSVDGPPELHDEIRGVPGGFKRLVETHAGLLRLKQKLDGLGLMFCITVTTANQDRMYEIIDFVRDTFSRPNINLIYVRGKPRDPALKKVDPEKYRTALKYLIEDEKKQGRWNNRPITEGLYLLRRELEASLILETGQNEHRIIPCTAGKLTCVIDETGNVWPCELLCKKLGNLREAGYDFKRIWKSQEANLCRAYITAGDCYCTQETNIMSSLTFSPQTLLYYLKKRGHLL
ncbi:MAG: radical SAM protein [bacterium]|nr:radical SAM protein [bacterium]